jgi:hypothetical protein
LGLLISTATRSLSESRQAMADATKGDGHLPSQGGEEGKGSGGGSAESPSGGYS